MRLIGVLDIRRGQVVRAVAGQRAQYRPLVSRWTRSTEAREVAQALMETFGLREFYVADLDAILDRRPNWTALEQLCSGGMRVWLDGGFRHAEEVRQALRQLDVHPVIGLETWQESAATPGESDAVPLILDRPAMFSLDAYAGRWLGAHPHWQHRSPAELAAWAWQSGFEHLLALDLAAVGTGQLQWTIGLLEAASPGAPDAQWYVGGGVSSAHDLQRLAEMGVCGVLVASALHDGRILPDQLRGLDQV
ncbi:1-(5-phosphoribosyl)-5-[(5-phosphoribosylamino) methylideneamino] imidazole-4-carboxamide isomerase [bacterium HR36]|nr:1-(5-phosphoribosyl)-5-[(5-phosphoribosylamino) methylideneamino] imidazole-4-carboxamide isomerase [bacterium HR36]